MAIMARKCVLAGFMTAVSVGASASPITWSGPTQFTNTGQLISNEDGVTLLEAYNPGGKGDLAVGGMVFTAGAGSLTGTPCVYEWATLAGAPTSDENMNQVLNSILYAGAPHHPALVFTNLTAGRMYKVQLFIVDDRGTGAIPGYLAAVDRNNGGIVGWDIGNGKPGYASFVTGSFQASGSTLSIPVELSIDNGSYGANGASLNAYLLVEVGGAPATGEPLVPAAASYSHEANPGAEVAYYPSQLLSAHPERNSSARDQGHPWVDGMHQPVPNHFYVDSGSGLLRVLPGHRGENELTFRQSGVLCPASPAFSFRFGIRNGLATLLPGVALGGNVSWLRDWPVDDYQIYPARVVYLLRSPSGQLKARLEVIQAVSTGGAGIVAKLNLKNVSSARLNPTLILAGYSGPAVLPETLPPVGAGLLQITCTHTDPIQASHGSALPNLHNADYVLLAGFDGGTSQKNLRLDPNASAKTYFMALLDAPDQPDPGIIKQVCDYFERNQAILPEVRRSLAGAALNAYVYCTAEGDKKWLSRRNALVEVFDASSAASSNGLYRSSPCRIDLPDNKLSSYLNYAANDLLPALVQPPGLVHDAKYCGVWHYIFAYRHQHAAMNLGLEKEAIDDLLLRSCNQKPDGFLRGVRADFKTDDHPTMYEESYIDAVYHYWKWTGDFEPVRQLWPAMVKAVQFIERVLNPDGDDLYLDLLHQYKSDSDSRGPSSVFQSAMVWRAYVAMAEFATRMQLPDASAYRTKSDRIHAAIQRELWSPEKVMIGSKGPLGMLRLHPECLEVEIPVRTGAVDPYQAYVITDWYLKNCTFKDAGKNVWVLGADWWPRVWTQGLNLPSDSIMIGMTALLSGCFEEGVQILSSYAGTAYKAKRFGDGYFVDSYQNPQRVGCGVAAATCQGAWGRALVEGMFGVEPHLDENYVTVRPNFPRSWKKASFERPALSISFDGTDPCGMWKITTASHVAARLQLPVFAPVESLRVNGRDAPVVIEPGIGCGRLTVNAPPGGAEMRLNHGAAAYTIRALTTNAVQIGGGCEIAYSGLDEIAPDDRFGFFSDIRARNGRVSMKLAKTGCGRATLFLNCRSGSMRWIQPVTFDTDNGIHHVQTVADSLPRGSRLVPVNLSAVYNENINTCFDHRWDWDHGAFFPYPELISTNRIDYWYYDPFVLTEPLPVKLRIGQVPFRVGTEGVLTEKNLAMIANTSPRELPTGLTIQIGRKANKIYLLSLNYVLAQKSYVPCVRIELRYADGSVEERDLVNPYNFDFFGQNSGINTREYALNPVPRPNQVYYKDTHLTMTDVLCDGSKILAEVRFRSIATETFFGLAGITLNIPEGE